METQLETLMRLAKETNLPQVITLPSMYGHLYCLGKVDKGIRWTAIPNEHGGVELTCTNN